MSNPSNSHSSCEEDNSEKDIVVSIILTESTSDVLNLDLPRLEDLRTDSESTICTIQPETSVTEKKKRCFMSWLQRNEPKDIHQGLAYFSNNMVTDESSATSLERCDSKKRIVSRNTRSSTSVEQTLHPIVVYTRPLFSVNSVAHQNRITGEANNIYISLKDSEVDVSSSEWTDVCRICHGGESIDDLLSVCECRGSIALTHKDCLERWLKESTTSHCELCQHHFQLIRKPKYGILKSIFVFLRHPGEHLLELLFDMFAFLVYTPAAITSTYMLMLLCESVARSHEGYSRNVSAKFMTFLAVLGMAGIDFTYSSWFMVNLQKHVTAWRNWHRNNCEIKLILPKKDYSSGSSSLEDEID